MEISGIAMSITLKLGYEPEDVCTQIKKMTAYAMEGENCK